MVFDPWMTIYIMDDTCHSNRYVYHFICLANLWKSNIGCLLSLNDSNVVVGDGSSGSGASRYGGSYSRDYDDGNQLIFVD